MSDEDGLESLSIEQRLLLDQFELRAISAPAATPLLVKEAPHIHRNVEDKVDSTTFSQSSSSSSSSSEEPGRENQEVNDRDTFADALASHPVEGDNVRCGNESDVSSCMPSAQREPPSRKGEALCQPSSKKLEESSIPPAHAQRSNMYLQESSADEEDERECADPERKTFAAEVKHLYAECTAPLFSTDSVRGATSTNKEDFHSVPRGGERLVVPLLSTAGPINVANTNCEKTLDERCEELAERFLQESAEVDAVALHLDRWVPAPSDFV